MYSVIGKTKKLKKNEFTVEINLHSVNVIELK